MKYYVLFNPLAGNGNGTEESEKLKGILNGQELVFSDITKITDFGTLFSQLSADDEIIICGGDGTLNRFINATYDLGCKNNIRYFATGSGNDFLRDIRDENSEPMPILINKYITDLPTVTVNGREYRFLNGVGYGIDGYCCEVGDKQKEISSKPVNYAGIAIKGLLFHYKPTRAVVEVDDKKYVFKKAWLCPTMNGRFYGGGMMATPDQKRLSEDKTVSVMLFHDSGKLRTLAVFPSIFKGTHVNHKKMIAVFSGHNIKVSFDRPTALQIDGETVLGVTEYKVKSRGALQSGSEQGAFEKAPHTPSKL